jgi:hypothetical protein
MSAPIVGTAPRSRLGGMTQLVRGQLVTVAGEGKPVDGILAHLASAAKAVVAVPDRKRGAVLRTVAVSQLSEREDESPADEELRRLIRRSASMVRGGGNAGGAGPPGGRSGFSRGAAHRPTGR